MKIAEQILETLDTLGSLQTKSIKTVKSEMEEETFQPPAGAVSAAKKALEWKEKYGDQVKAMTQTGWTRARQLASGEKVSLDIVKRMAAFNRHRENSKVAPEHKDEPWKDNGHVAWLGWGGDAGVDWAIKISDSNKDESVQAELQKKHPYLNNVKVVSGPHTQSEARAIAKEGREKGKFYSVFHLDGPKSGPQSKYVVTTGKD